MRFVADVHLHSRYSRATSRDLTSENLHKWAALKGVHVVGTGDFTHPEWFAELQEKLEPAGDGLYQLKPALRDAVEAELPEACRQPVRFVLSVEISSIYKKGERTRKVHNVILMPDLGAAEALNQHLGAIGNIKSDGRPILGLDSRALLEISLEVCPDVLFIPAHIWTPHFAVLGASSGFETLDECYEDLLPHIPAVETGLSSDPAMNSRLSALDGFAVISNSDAHSLRKLAREATCFDTEMSYSGMLEALRSRDPARLTGTLEFYPEEGKYHLDGHRKCGVCWKPAQTLAADGRCPECGRKLTVGVLHRVEKLADRAEGEGPAVQRPFEYLIPLEEIIGSALGVGPATKTVARTYEPLLARIGPELEVLRHASIDEIARHSDHLVAEGVRRMRTGEVHIAPGFDGEFGKVEVFTPEERERLESQERLFDLPAHPVLSDDAAAQELAVMGDAAVLEAAAAVEGMAADPAKVEGLLAASEPDAEPASDDGLDAEQRRAVTAKGGPLAVVAGPGSGKTRTLTHRIAHLIDERGADPERIAAVTFTNKAADEVRERLVAMLGRDAASRVTVATFHRLALDLMRSCSDLAPRTVLDQHEARNVLEAVLAEEELSLAPAATQEAISRLKANAALPGDVEDESLRAAYRAYLGRLAAYGACDYDGILLSFLRLMERSPEVLAAVRTRVEHLLVDEFQDVNLVQYRLVKLMASGSGLFVIGDPDQAIYGFRGASPAYFEQLASDYPTTRVLHLGRNYRSHPAVVEVAAAVMGRTLSAGADEEAGLFAAESAARGEAGDAGAHGAGASSPPVVAAREVADDGPDEPARLRLLAAPGEKAEGIAVVREISRLVGGADMVQTDSHSGRPDSARTLYGFADIAVLYRTGRQAEALEECFLTEGIPYRLVGHRGFLERRGVREAVAFFRFAAEPGRGLRILEALRVRPFDPGKAAMGRIASHLAYADGAVEMESLLEELKPAAEDKVRALWAAAALYRKMTFEVGPFEVLERWREEFGAAGEADGDAFDRLLSVAERTATMAELLDLLLLGQEADVEQTGRRGPAVDAVRLMTMHASKGLEFPVVLITGVEDGLVPLREDGRDTDEAEERRLFYVALTRAREEVVLLRAERRRRYGKRLQPEVSPFVANIPAELISTEEVGRSRREPNQQLTLF